jgi:hypothetical protein
MSQAIRPATTKSTRRRFLAFLSAGAAVAPAALAAAASAPAPETALNAPAPAVAIPSPDVGLLQLFDEYRAVRSDSRRLSRKAHRLYEKHKAATPLPDVLRVQPGDAELGLPELPSERVEQNFGYSFCIQELQEPEWRFVEETEPPEGTQFRYGRGGEVVRSAPPSAAARARADEIIKAHAKWKRKRDREPAALRAASRQRDAALKLAERLRTKIDRTRAVTITGLAVKAQVAAIESEDDTQFADTTLASILRDMRAFPKPGAPTRRLEGGNDV